MDQPLILEVKIGKKNHDENGFYNEPIKTP